MNRKVVMTNSSMAPTKDEEIGLIAGEAGSPSQAAVVRPTLEEARRATTWSMAMSLLVFLGLLGIIFTFLHIENSHATPYMSPKDTPFTAKMDSLNAPLNVLVVGDWGRNGKYNQSFVANQMGKVGNDLDVNFIISSGDNFYDSGLETVNDGQFATSFSRIYQDPSLMKPWYAVLGNHDYRGNPEVQVEGGLNRRDARWFCDYTYTLSVDLDKGKKNAVASSVEFFFIDTNPFEEDYWTPDSASYKWKRATPREEVIADQLKNLTDALEASTATWKLVVGHHTMYSYGTHGNTPELIEKILPILNANQVDMYINGHDHCLQDIKRSDSGIHFVTSGAGSKAWKGEHADTSKIKDSKLYYDGQGFVSLSITPTDLQMNFYDMFGTILHQIHLEK